MEIASSDNSDWLIDYSIVDDIPIAGNFDWPSQAAAAAAAINASSTARQAKAFFWLNFVSCLVLEKVTREHKNLHIDS